MKGRGSLVVVGAARQRVRGELRPLVGEQARDEDVVGARQLPADFGDLGGRLSLRQNDFRESDAAQTVEIQRVIRDGHWCDG
jgi:hypothetical protein